MLEPMPLIINSKYSLVAYFSSSRKSSSWHTSLRIRKKSEKKEKEVKKETKLENGYRKSREGLANKVSVKVSMSPNLDLYSAALKSFFHIFTINFCFILFQLLNPNYIYDGKF